MAFLGIDRYPQTGGKLRKMYTKRRKNLRKRKPRKRRSQRNRRGGMHTQQQSFKPGDRVWYTHKRGEIGDGVREQWDQAVVPEAPSRGNIAHPTHIKLWKGDRHVFANRANVDNTQTHAHTRDAAQRMRELQRASKRPRIRESSQGEQDRIDAKQKKTEGRTACKGDKGEIPCDSCRAREVS